MKTPTPETERQKRMKEGFNVMLFGDRHEIDMLIEADAALGFMDTRQERMLACAQVRETYMMLLFYRPNPFATMTNWVSRMWRSVFPTKETSNDQSRP